MSQTVLVVEDTELLRRMYSDQLAADGFNVLQAPDGLQAMSVMRTETPDLVLLDLVMPNMGGLEVLEAMSKDDRLRSIPVLILSNRGEDEDMEKGVELGASDFLIKNEVRPGDISHRIMTILKSSADDSAGARHYRVLLRDHEGDADQLVADASLIRRFWCPACEVELMLEMIVDERNPGWYRSHFACPRCGKEY